MATRKTKWLIWVTALMLIMACVPTTQSIPTVDPGAVNTLIVQTANAAASQTAAALPSATPTVTVIPTRNTATPTPTATSTVIFVFLTPTPLITETFAPSGSRSDAYACQLMRISPPNGTIFAPRQDFTAVWVVKNIGKRKWDRKDVDYAYASGDKIHRITSYDLSDSVGTGSSLDLSADMQAPKDPGTYTTTWTMQVGERTFCPLELTIEVQEEKVATSTSTTAAP